MKVLLVYANSTGSTMIPIGLASISIVLQMHNHEVQLFDTTLYDTTNNANLDRVKIHSAEKYDDNIKLLGDFGKMMFDLNHQIGTFQPNVVAVSTVEDTYHIAKALCKSVHFLHKDIKIAIGGVFPTFAKHIIEKDLPYVDIFKGDGEFTFTFYCDNNFRMPASNPLIPIDIIPTPDYHLFGDHMLYRPMQGKVYKTIPIEIQRGCPFSCNFCNSKAQKDIFGSKYYRKKSMDRLEKQLSYIVNIFAPELIYWIGDSFLYMSDEEWKQFCDIYSQYKIPFWMNTRPETITQDKINKLEELGCIRCNIGIEHGNETFRKEMINRNYTNEQIYNACKCFSTSNIHLVVNSIIGFPEETPKLLNDTIMINKLIYEFVDSMSVFIFAPYHGTKLRTYCEEHNLIEKDKVITQGMLLKTHIKNPLLPDELLIDVQTNFFDYVQGVKVV